MVHLSSLVAPLCRFPYFLCHEPGDLRFYQAREVCVLQPDRLHVVAGVEIDMLVLLQRRVDVNLEAEEVAEWRHRADLTIRKTRDEFIFGGEPRLLGAQTSSNQVQADLAAARDHP